MEMKYAIGIDFGTLSARAILVNVHTGEEITSSVYGYQDAVITEYLPNSNVKLPQDFALQNPMDYQDATIALLKDVVSNSKVPVEDIISIGLDFTACTVVAVDDNMVPLCMDAKFARNPHAWVKLWKHHSAQEEADRINQKARERGESFLQYYGSTSSSEWMFAKVLETYVKAPDVYAATYRFLHAGDYIVYFLTGEETTSTCMAGFKSFWNAEDGYPSKEYLDALKPGFSSVLDKITQKVDTVGSPAGTLSDRIAKLTGLSSDVTVAVAMIDAHAAVPVVGATDSNSLLMAMGTSICHMAISKELVLADGICGVVKDGIIPGYYGYEAGQAAVGDIYDWFINMVSGDCYVEASARNMSPFQVMDERAEKLSPGASGLVALDWFNGNRSMLNDTNLTGMLVGLTLNTKQEEVYRALIESTAYGTRSIIETMEEKGIRIERVYACGGLSRKSKFVMQLFADITGREITTTAIEQTTALGAAMYGMVAAGKEKGGYDSFSDLTEKIVPNIAMVFMPNKGNKAIYDKLYSKYKQLTEFFGINNKDIMHELKTMKSK